MDNAFEVTFDRMHSSDKSSIPNGVALHSQNHAYYAVLCVDGNLKVYVSTHFHPKNELWSSNSSNKGQGPFRLAMQDDGNLVIYDSHDKATWSSDTWNKGQSPYRVVVQNDGNLVLYDSHHKALWSTNTYRN